MLLIIDNFDSFTYNLVQYFGELGVEQKVVRNTAISKEEAVALNPERVVVSPGPCTPDEAGNSLDIIAAFAGRTPLLGVCLGHQCIGQHFGARVVCADRIMHGKLSPIRHDRSPCSTVWIHHFPEHVTTLSSFIVPLFRNVSKLPLILQKMK